MSLLLAAWTFVATPIGRLVAVGGLSLLLGFSQGWAIKARMDRSATLQAVIAKQRIDLKAAQETADAGQRGRDRHLGARRHQPGDHP